ncbi:MAG: DUF2608 domain-containing protein [Victivallaceae bacterium]
MKLPLLTLLFSFVFISSGSAYVSESLDLFGFQSNFEIGDLICIVLDDVLLQPAQTLGNRQWLLDRVASAEQDSDLEDPYKQSLNEWLAVQNITEQVPVAPDNIPLCHAHNIQGFPILVLTDRPLSIANRTLFQMQKMNICFNEPFPGIKTRILKNPYHQEEPLCSLLYKDGTLFTSGLKTGLSMGKALFLLLDTFERTYKRIIVIDHDEKNLLSVKAACDKAGVTFLGIRYIKTDKNGSEYNPEIPALQFERMLDLISDEHAELVLDSLNKTRVKKKALR